MVVGLTGTVVGVDATAVGVVVDFLSSLPPQAVSVTLDSKRAITIGGRRTPAHNTAVLRRPGSLASPMTMNRPLALIVNPSAGGGRAGRVLGDVLKTIEGLGLAVRAEATRSLDHARELARTAADAGELVVALSGDGLVGAVAGELAGRDDALLGILPGGRGNDLARVLGIPLDDLPAACKLLRDGTARALDVARVGDRPFIGIASFGFDSDANRIANEAPPRLGNLVYAYGAIRALAAWKPAHFVVSIDGVDHESVGYSVAVANSKAYGGGMYMAPDAELDDGLLDVVISGKVSKLHFLRQLPAVFKGEHIHDPAVTVLRGAEIVVDADRPFTIYADGDPIGAIPATLTVQRHALKVLCP